MTGTRGKITRWGPAAICRAPMVAIRVMDSLKKSFQQLC